MFKINGYVWRVYLVSPDHPELRRSDGEQALGACDSDKLSIYINDTLGPIKMKKVLCHEIAHALIFSYGVELDLQQEELLADFMATFGHEIIHTTDTIIREP